MSTNNEIIEISRRTGKPIDFSDIPYSPDIEWVRNSPLKERMQKKKKEYEAKVNRWNILKANGVNITLEEMDEYERNNI